MPNKGWRHSKESKEQMRLSALGNSDGGMTGKHHSQKSNEKNRKSHLGKVPWNKGKRDPNAKRNLPKTKKKRIASEAARENMSKSHMGQPSPRKGVHLSEATKKKLSLSHILPDDQKPRVKKICKGCGIEFEVTPSQDSYGNGKYHSKECQIKYSVGKNSPSWKGGVAPLQKIIRMSQEYINWRNAVFKRDNYLDWFSGCKGDIVAHHIKKFSDIIDEYNICTFEDALNCPKLWDVNNGVTMLNSSHQAFHDMYGW